MISVIIPTYNRERTIERAVKSVLNQTYSDLEVIVIDDCSTDNSISILKKIEDERLKIIRLNKNSGACKARNVGIEVAKGEYITFQDSDDEWHKNKVQIQIDTLHDKNVDIVACSFYKFQNNKRKQWPKDKIENNYLSRLLRGNYITTQGLLLRRECLENIKFDENLPRYQDWELAIRLLSSYSFYFINKPLFNLYIQNDSITRNYIAGMYAAEYILDKHEKLYKLNPGADKILKKIVAFGKMKTNDFERNLYKEIMQEYGFDILVLFRIFQFYFLKLRYSLCASSKKTDKE